VTPCHFPTRVMGVMASAGDSGVTALIITQMQWH
jgi:hypothetical protein